jgi:hypothetical protein
MYDIQHCFICHPSDSTVSKDAGIETSTVATTALAARRSNHSARSHPLRKKERKKEERKKVYLSSSRTNIFIEITAGTCFIIHG